MNDADENIFKKCVFLVDMPGLTSIHEEECIKKIMKWVESSGGRVVYHNSHELLPDTAPKSGSKHPSYTHIVTETVESSDAMKSIASDTPRVNLVYVFACLQQHSVLDHHCYAPLPSTRPENRGFTKKKKAKERYIGSFSGFVGRERVLVEVMMQSLGMRTFRTLSINGPEKADVLIASDTEEESHKILAAMGVGIPVVNFQWLCDCFQEWVYLAVDGDGSYRGSAGVDCIVREDAQVVEDPVCIPDSIDEAYSSTPSHAPTEDDCFQQLGTVVEDNEEGEEGGGDNENENEEDGEHLGEDHHVGGDREDEYEEEGDIDDNVDEERNMETSKPSSPSSGAMEAPPQVMREIPRERAQKRKSSETVQNKTKKNKSKDDDEEKTKSNDKKSDEKEQKNHAPAHITISGMHTNEQKECAAMLRASRFRYTIGTHDWDPAFTHVITPSMRRNQKCLCAIASGAWILSPEYLRASTSDVTANEEDYEILDGSPSSGIDDNICRFWRQSPQRPFQGLVCGLYRIPPSSIPSRKDIRYVCHYFTLYTYIWLAVDTYT